MALTYDYHADKLIKKVHWFMNLSENDIRSNDYIHSSNFRIYNYEWYLQYRVKDTKLGYNGIYLMSSNARKPFDMSVTFSILGEGNKVLHKSIPQVMPKKLWENHFGASFGTAIFITQKKIRKIIKDYHGKIHIFAEIYTLFEREVKGIPLKTENQESESADQNNNECEEDDVIEEMSDFDLVICAKGNLLRAHKSRIEGKVNNEFYSMTRSGPDGELLILIDFDVNIVKEFLRFVYLSKVKELAKIAFELFEMAKKFDYKELMNFIIDEISKNFESRNLIETINFAEKYKIDKIIQQSFEKYNRLICGNFMNSKEWKTNKIKDKLKCKILEYIIKARDDEVSTGIFETVHRVKSDE